MEIYRSKRQTLKKLRQKITSMQSSKEDAEYINPKQIRWHLFYKWHIHTHTNGETYKTICKMQRSISRKKNLWQRKIEREYRERGNISNAIFYPYLENRFIHISTLDLSLALSKVSVELSLSLCFIFYSLHLFWFWCVMCCVCVSMCALGCMICIKVRSEKEKP